MRQRGKHNAPAAVFVRGVGKQWLVPYLSGFSNCDVTAEQRNYKQSDSSTKGDVTVSVACFLRLYHRMQQRPLYRTNGLTYFVAFMGSRLLLFLWMMLKWSLMIFVVGLALWCMASFIFLSIFVIYRAIRILCQCELNEGR